jgi:hypothetical protein
MMMVTPLEAECAGAYARLRISADVRETRQSTRRIHTVTGRSPTVSTQAPAQWWVRSFADRDTHRGTYSEASRSVRSRCSVEFVPLAVGIPARRQPLPGNPQDPDQICPTCYRSSVK